ncbi:hypothetical protein PHYBLDRAFT_68594 [Phycomyces blakesleeanus NRRL 1555(-)]|uniref:Uncharacterized protein n=1 Tax=Phycomyces blakesleeanus (strain ATCC 8743b / DSM 1359 / FGSC 10004 / NBRC 33097 / NRRL 1555) TaxID=763407 RepID=A0A163B2F2_PHYB8|nr:hypothetical protein PHYBLDRAFT_68594 [Phycomyces blakesleeanus NRRL 1555(-)]OAD77901.1 hypothetical protein PHYBLDRAFT_68594 [Phycomyces blakesleeanus NRRL 1555(-)]|eukprot:XP_018295941.1 hypothetical protein PHYBLDRAFT_68594 [Phycomyces blakesleeanus NRRL 1555(-)]
MYAYITEFAANINIKCQISLDTSQPNIVETLLIVLFSMLSSILCAKSNGTRYYGSEWGLLQRKAPKDKNKRSVSAHIKSFVKFTTKKNRSIKDIKEHKGSIEHC